jgi:hypothetical protein
MLKETRQLVAAGSRGFLCEWATYTDGADTTSTQWAFIWPIVMPLA